MNLTITIYRDDQGQWRWRAQAGNNRNVANGGEGYHNRQDCVDIVNALFLDENNVLVEFEKEA